MEGRVVSVPLEIALQSLRTSFYTLEQNQLILLR